MFLVVNGLGLLISVIYNHSTPNLYENDSHSKIGWIATWIASTWVIISVINTYAGVARRKQSIGKASHQMTAATMAQYQRMHSEEPIPARWSGDSGQGTERNSASLAGDARSPSAESENQRLFVPRYNDGGDDEYHPEAEKNGLLRNNPVDRFLSRNIPRVAVGRTLGLLRVIYYFGDRTLLIFGFLAITTGTVIYGGIGVSDLIRI
jgi:hypothetical protein